MALAHKGHSRLSKTSTDSWITPKPIIDRLGPFDLDPCSCNPQPWPCAAVNWTENGLIRPWLGHVWLNPPYGRELRAWLERMAQHNNGIALVFARTDTQAFHRAVFGYASSILFIEGRIRFFLPSGELHPSKWSSGGPSVLIGYGELADSKLAKATDLGAFVRLQPRQQTT